MMDIVYCPRRDCQYPVTRDPDDNMASCPVCQYAFCIRCKMVYHGVEPCKISSGIRLNFIDNFHNKLFTFLYHLVLNKKIVTIFIRFYIMY